MNCWEDAANGRYVWSTSPALPDDCLIVSLMLQYKLYYPDIAAFLSALTEVRITDFDNTNQPPVSGSMSKRTYRELYRIYRERFLNTYDTLLPREESETVKVLLANRDRLDKFLTVIADTRATPFVNNWLSIDMSVRVAIASMTAHPDYKTLAAAVKRCHTLSSFFKDS